MPVRSKAQLKKLAELEKTGKVKPGTLQKWVRDTPGGVGKLPERVHPKQEKAKPIEGLRKRFGK